MPRASRPLARLAMLASSALLVLLLVRPTGAQGEKPEKPGLERAHVSKVLDTLHDAASKADFDRYFSCFDPEGVFLGTDASERWIVSKFRFYVRERFATGKGWTYTSTARHIYLSPDRLTAWFDETLMNEKYGVCRGSGVLVNNGFAWVITQYNLSVPIPNDLLPGVAESIKAFVAGQGEQPAPAPPEPAPAPSPNS